MTHRPKALEIADKILYIENGQVVQKYIRNVPEIEKYVIMPDHIHLLLFFSWNYGTGDPSPTIGQMMAWFKYQTTKEINAVRNMPGQKVWQRSYHDHIIRGLQDYFEIMTYIDENGKGHKPFVVPQHTPDFYLHSMKSYNVPEFIKEPVELDRRMIIETAKEGQALKVAAQ